MPESISLCCMSGGPPHRTAAMLGLLRDRVDEVVVAVDDRVAADVLGPLADVADRLVRYPYADPPGRAVAWLFGLCSGSWIFQIDDDEVPSAALLEALRSVPSPELTHAWIARRWLFPDPRHWLADWPWTPDHQVRLIRNDPLVLRFPGLRHVPVQARGPSRVLDAPLYHLDCVVSPRAAREAKAARNERDRPGLRVGGRALNEAYYVPESRPEARIEPVPAGDVAAIAAVLAAGPGASRAVETPAAAREEIDLTWAQRPRPSRAYRARLAVVSPDLRFVTDEVRPVEVEVENLGGETWPWGADGDPEVRLSYHWRRDGTEIARGGLRTALPHALAGGATALVLARVQAPPEPGRYELAFDLVHEHVRWFGCESVATAEVLARKRVGVLAQYRVGDFPAADEATAELLARVVESAPDYEPVVLGPRPDELRERFGHEAGEGPREPLLRGIDPGRRRLQTLGRLVTRTARLRRSAFGRELDRLDALVIAPLDEPAERLERWLQAAAAETARRAGVRVVLTHRPSEGGNARLARAASAVGLERVAG